jgi:phospholipase/carboxylesterase
MSDPLLDCIELAANNTHRASVIWLHGLGADGNDFVPIVPELDLPDGLGVRFVFPHAPVRSVTLNAGMRMRAWFDVHSLGRGGDFNREHLEVSARQLEALIQKELDRGIASERILLAGFSQGGAVVLHTGFRYPRRLAGILAISTYHPDLAPNSDRLPAERAEANRGLPVFLAHGELDPLIPVSLAERSRRAVEDAGYDVEWHTYPMAHAVCPEEIRDISAWLRARLLE